MIAFTRAKGVYGGLNLDGTLVNLSDDWNRAYYSKPVQPIDIFVRGTVSNPMPTGCAAKSRRRRAARDSRLSPRRAPVAFRLQERSSAKIVRLRQWPASAAIPAALARGPRGRARPVARVAVAGAGSGDAAPAQKPPAASAAPAAGAAKFSQQSSTSCWRRSRSIPTRCSRRC